VINLFISDLHLDESHPDIARIFLQFLQQDALQADALYILGDFFEAWVGDDNQTPFNDSIFRALRQLTDHGVRVYLQHGNRDFLLGKKFSAMTGVALLPDEYKVELGGEPYLLMHGDTLCTQDKAYLKFRKHCHNWLLQKIFLILPLKSRQKMAMNMRAQSKIRNREKPRFLMDVEQAEVERVMRKHEVKHLIHGHTHRPALHSFNLQGLPATRMVLAPWHNEGSVLISDDANSTLQIKTLK
jgi:UDP-2,3-diacylglucosamine hydrolase